MSLSSTQRKRYEQEKEDLINKIALLARKDTNESTLEQSRLTDELITIERLLEDYTNE